MNIRFTSGAIALVFALSACAGVAGAASPAAPPVSDAPADAPFSDPLLTPKITSAQAEAALREHFTLPRTSAGFSLTSLFSLPGEDRPVWQFQLTVPKGKGTTTIDFATVDAVSGRILRYGAYGMMPGPVRSGPLAAVVTEEEARARAWVLVQKLRPEKAAVLKEAPAGTVAPPQYQAYGSDVAGDAYSFTWIEYHDGIPFPDSGISVAIHKQTLEPVALADNLIDTVTFRPGPAKVTADAALKMWQAAAMSTLSYQPVSTGRRYGAPRTTAYRPVYEFDNSHSAVDATSGAWVPSLLEELYPGLQMPGTPALEPLPPSNVVPVVPQALPLTDDAAQQFARSVLELPQGTLLRTDVPSGGEPGRLRFVVSERAAFTDITLDAKTGLIRAARRPLAKQTMGPAPGGSTSPAVTAEQAAQAKQAAFAVVNTYYGQLREQLRLESRPAPPQFDQARLFGFARYVNGLRVAGEAVSVSIDLSTMKWSSMHASWSTGLSFPTPTGAIDPNRAEAIILDDRKPTLVYELVIPNSSEITPGTPMNLEASLAYIMTPEIIPRVDALTGELLAKDARPVPDMSAAYRQAAGHWAEGELQFLLSREIIRPDELKPSAALTRAQAVTLLLNRMAPGDGPPEVPVALPYNDVTVTDPAYGPVRAAWREGWLFAPGDDTAFRPDSPVTRTEFAVWAARVLGAGDLARSDLTAPPGYTDFASLTAEQRHAVSFLHALGLLRSGAAFRGGDALTQAEGAALTVRIYNYLLSR